MRRGFTLMEVMIVVVILGILASIVVPTFLAATDGAREAAMIRNLAAMRLMLTTYSCASQSGRFPATVAELERAIGSIPQNPFNGGLAVRIVDNAGTVVPDEEATVGTKLIGWFYHPPTGALWANTEGRSSRGQALSEL